MESSDKNQERTYSLHNLSAADINLIGTALMGLPAKHVNNLLARLEA